MNIYDLTISQLKRAVSIKEKIEELSRELRSILGASGNSMPAQKRKRVMSASAKRKLSSSQKVRWAKLRRAKPATRSAKPAAKASKKKMSPAARAKLSAKLKAYWAKKKKTNRG